MKPNRIRIVVACILGLACAAVLIIILDVHLTHDRTQTGSPLTNNNSPAGNKPLPPLSTAADRVNSYEPARGDIKYRIVSAPSLGTDAATGWNIYTSREYGFSFLYPPQTKLDSTEALGYLLPENQAVSGSRDTLQVVMSNTRQAYFILFMNDPDFSVPNATTTAQTSQTVNNLTMRKTIMRSLDPQYGANEIIVYTFTYSKKQYIWYGVFDLKDLESINDFESIVASTKFNL